ncbi:uncharacterized protein [Miscanthus floridulus]|uniref:uncharacterized protein n=1 Tax=Miscanthus floridulus TaxID=154761 RepID=UPI00345A1A9C
MPPRGCTDDASPLSPPGAYGGRCGGRIYHRLCCPMRRRCLHVSVGVDGGDGAWSTNGPIPEASRAPSPAPPPDARRTCLRRRPPARPRSRPRSPPLPTSPSPRVHSLGGPSSPSPLRSAPGSDGGPAGAACRMVQGVCQPRSRSGLWLPSTKNWFAGDCSAISRDDSDVDELLHTGCCHSQSAIIAQHTQMGSTHVYLISIQSQTLFSHMRWRASTQKLRQNVL